MTAAHTAPRCEKCGGPKPGERLTCSLDECPYADNMTYGQGLPPAGGWKRDMRDELSAASALREADRIAADFAEIPFEGHEARKLAFAYLRLRSTFATRTALPFRRSASHNYGRLLMPSNADRTSSAATAPREIDVLLAQFSAQADRLTETLNGRMRLRSAANITTDELGDWIAKAEGCTQALRDVQLLRRLGAHV